MLNEGVSGELLSHNIREEFAIDLIVGHSYL